MIAFAFSSLCVLLGFISFWFGSIDLASFCMLVAIWMLLLAIWAEQLK